MLQWRLLRSHWASGIYPEWLHAYINSDDYMRILRATILVLVVYMSRHLFNQKQGCSQSHSQFYHAGWIWSWTWLRQWGRNGPKPNDGALHLSWWWLKRSCGPVSTGRKKPSAGPKVAHWSWDRVHASHLSIINPAPVMHQAPTLTSGHHCVLPIHHRHRWLTLSQLTVWHWRHK